MCNINWSRWTKNPKNCEHFCVGSYVQNTTYTIWHYFDWFISSFCFISFRFYRALCARSPLSNVRRKKREKSIQFFFRNKKKNQNQSRYYISGSIKCLGHGFYPSTSWPFCWTGVYHCTFGVVPFSLNFLSLSHWFYLWLLNRFFIFIFCYDSTLQSQLYFGIHTHTHTLRSFYNSCTVC